MILSKKDYVDFLTCDFLANNWRHFDPIRKYLMTLRKAEYYTNCGKKVLSLFFRAKLRRLSYKYTTFIPINTFGKGLSIAHLGGIYINSTARIGDYARISQNLTIGSTDGENVAPKIGECVFIGPNVCVIGDITISDRVAIGAGAVVVKNIDCSKTTWAGVPAKKDQL